MAYADYRLCDVCGEKVFYDVQLNYETAREAPDKMPFRVAGGEPHPSGYRLDRLGDWAVICTDCAETHETIVGIRAAQEPKP